MFLLSGSTTSCKLSFMLSFRSAGMPAFVPRRIGQSGLSSSSSISVLGSAGIPSFVRRTSVMGSSSLPQRRMYSRPYSTDGFESSLNPESTYSYLIAVPAANVGEDRPKERNRLMILGC